MPRYFFDLDINGQVQRDTTGRELESRQEAKERADDLIYCLLSLWDRAQALDCACTVHVSQLRICGPSAAPRDPLLVLHALVATGRSPATPAR